MLPKITINDRNLSPWHNLWLVPLLVLAFFATVGLWLLGAFTFAHWLIG